MKKEISCILASWGFVATILALFPLASFAAYGVFSCAIPVVVAIAGLAGILLGALLHYEDE